MRSLEESNSQRQKIEWWLPGAGAGGMGSGCLMGTASALQDKKVLEDLLHNNVNILNTTEPYT